jgi:signal transduction histidine kinase
LWPVLIPGAAFALLHVAWGIALLGGRTEDPGAPVFSVLFFGRCAALIGLAGGLALALLRVRGARAALARLVGELGEAPAPGALEAAMAGAAGDPSLKLVYPLSRSGGYVDGDGHGVDVTTSSRRAATPIVRGREPVAVVMHDPTALAEPALVEDLAAVARLAVDNERLQAEARAHLVELSASRARIVAASDAERRRLERDLHDGAQQRLLALSYDLRLARANAGRAISTTLDAVIEEAETALDELRRLAHGIYPAVLEESGLAPALETLADDAPIPVEFGELTPERVPEGVERTAYIAVSEAISDAAARGATFVTVDVTRRADQLLVAADDDGGPRTRPLTEIADRVGALNGSLEVGPTVMRAELPCV